MTSSLTRVAAALFCVVTWLLGTNLCPATDQRPPNVVVILADDLGWSDLGCYGADLHETPNLDRLAQQGVRFTSAYAASICSPTRAALMTGKHYARLHMTIWYEGSLKPDLGHVLTPPATVSNLPLAETTLAERLHQAGYLTALVGKWHLGSDPTGFDRWIVLPGQGDYFDPAFLVPEGRKAIRGYVTDIITDLAIDFLSKPWSDEQLISCLDTALGSAPPRP